jgi:hypothetical protein
VIQLTRNPLPVQSARQPPADVYETATGVSVTIELAGIEPAEVDVLCFERVVVVQVGGVCRPCTRLAFTTPPRFGGELSDSK